MKKLLGITLALASIGLAGSSAEATATELSRENITVTANASPQWQRDGHGRRNWRRPRVVTQTRTVRYGRRLFREIYQVTYLPNGRTNTRLISRTRIG